MPAALAPERHGANLYKAPAFAACGHTLVSLRLIFSCAHKDTGFTKYIIDKHKKKGPNGPFFYCFKKGGLLIVDVHRNFKTKTNVAIFRSFPFHYRILMYKLKVCMTTLVVKALLQFVCQPVKNKI